MLDKQGRILISEDFKISNIDKVYIYFSMEEKLFFILLEENEKEFFTHERVVDSKMRFFLPKDILKEYKVKHVRLARKDGIIYILPVYPSKDE